MNYQSGSNKFNDPSSPKSPDFGAINGYKKKFLKENSFMTFSQDPINTLENRITKNKTKSISVYLVLILAILIFLALLPVIKIDISSQSRGIVRGTTDNVPVTSLVNGKVTFVNLKKNNIVHKGDTLVQLIQEDLDTEKATNQEVSSTVQDQVHDLSLVILGKGNTLKMANNKNQTQTAAFYTFLTLITSILFLTNYVLLNTKFRKTISEFRNSDNNSLRKTPSYPSFCFRKCDKVS